MKKQVFVDKTTETQENTP